MNDASGSSSPNTTRALVLGAGMVGRVMAADLARDDDAEFEVTIADVSEVSLGKARAIAPNVTTRTADLSNANVIRELVREFDIVLGALPSALGFNALRAVIEAGRNYCDISFMPENALEFDALAKEHSVTAVVDNGVAPGLSNLLVGYAASQLGTIERAVIYVGGIPDTPEWPFKYKAGFAPSDVIEEYTRPARIVENGRIVEREALTEPELLEFSEVGTLEAVNTDGLRSLAYTIDAKHMVEKTLRYPGHYELMRVLRHMGLFSQEHVRIGREQVEVRPIDLTSALMFPHWEYRDDEADLTVMRVRVEGMQNDGTHKVFQWDLYDRRDEATGFTSMSRTTAFPNTIMARKVARGQVRMPGVIPPELLGSDHDLVSEMTASLADRNVLLKATVVD